MPETLSYVSVVTAFLFKAVLAWLAIVASAQVVLFFLAVQDIRRVRAELKKYRR